MPPPDLPYWYVCSSSHQQVTQPYLDFASVSTTRTPSTIPQPPRPSASVAPPHTVPLSIPPQGVHPPSLLPPRIFLHDRMDEDLESSPGPETQQSGSPGASPTLPYSNSMDSEEELDNLNKDIHGARGTKRVRLLALLEGRHEWNHGNLTAYPTADLLNSIRRILADKVDLAELAHELHQWPKLLSAPLEIKRRGKSSPQDLDPMSFVLVIRALLWKQESVESRPCADFMGREPCRDLNIDHRMLLFDWLVEVALEWNLQDITLHRAISIVDRFLSKTEKPVVREIAQLLGVCCLMIAIKCEEVVQHRLRDYAKVTANTYDPQHIHRMEVIVLNTLKYVVMVPTLNDFVLAYLRMIGAEWGSTVWWHSSYLSEVVQHYPDLVGGTEPALIAMGCITVSAHASGLRFADIWQPWMEELFPYHLSDLQDVCDRIYEMWGEYEQECHQCHVNLRYVSKKKKYRTRTRSNVAALPIPGEPPSVSL